MSKTIVEIKGIKMEVDMRHARRIEELRVGSKVRVLAKEYGGAEVHNGVIIGFEQFPTLPTIVIAYMKVSYSVAELKFLHWNANTKDVEVVAATDDDLDSKRADILKYFDREEAKLRRAAEDLAERREFFLDKFAVYWTKQQPAPEGEVQAAMQNADEEPVVAAPQSPPKPF